MFGCFGVYYQNIIYLFVQKRSSKEKENGVSIAVKKEHAKEMNSLFPRGRINTSTDKKRPWLFISENSPVFEDYCLKFCEMIIKRDKQVGRTPPDI
jgi:hypothetical protein